MIQHKLWFDRHDNTIDGVITLQRYDTVTRTVEKLFERLPARSGQWGYTRTNWVTQKSPTPYGAHWLRTRPVPLRMSPVGTRFFPIGSTQKNIGIIRGAGGYRTDCGLHYENDKPGSAGCTVVLVDTPARLAMADAMFDYIESLPEEFIPIEVL